MIIGISGKQGSGKDLAGKIVQYLIYNNHRKNNGFNEISFHQYDDGFPRETSWTIHKFADKLKDCVCLILGCTRKQLEDREYKETELGEEWWFNNIVPENGFGTKLINWDRDLKPQKMTPRLLLQLLGTECGRHIIHPNIWVNATMVDYYCTKCGKEEDSNISHVEFDNCIYPNWIFTDVRFPNECEAIKKHNGIVIRLQRTIDNTLDIDSLAHSYVINIITEKYGFETSEYPDEISIKTITHLCNEGGYFKEQKLRNEYVDLIKQYVYVQPKEHESETALDFYKFDYVIDNNSTIEYLIEQIKLILIKEKII